MPHPMSEKFLYPPARRDAVVDNYHGTPVADPYRWLEDPQSPETQAWLEAQQRLTSAWFAAMPTRDSIKARLTELWNYLLTSAKKSTNLSSEKVSQAQR